MSEMMETFDELFKVVRRQAARVEELEQRIADLERRLDKSNVIEFKTGEREAERAKMDNSVLAGSSQTSQKIKGIAI